MHITRWGEYGILCCMYLGEKHKITAAVGAAEIAKAQRIQLQYAQQILHRLRKGGIVRSIRGPRGGFKLINEPDKISLRDILYASEGNTFELVCDTNPVKAEGCKANGADCRLSGVWQELKAAIDSLLGKRTLASVLGNGNGCPGC